MTRFGPASHLGEPKVRLESFPACQLDVMIAIRVVIEQDFLGIRWRTGSEPPAGGTGRMSLITEPEVFEALFETPHVLVALLDDELRFVRVNEAYATAVGRTPQSMAGLAHFDLYPHEENEALFREVLRTGRPHRVRAKPFEHPDQPERPMTYWDWTLSAIRDGGGRTVGLLFQLVDVTDHIVIEKLAAERALMLREIHHRVKNNIQVVSAFLGEVSYTHPETRGTVDRALRRVGSIARMHETLLSSRDLASVDLAKYARAIATEVAMLHGRDEVVVKVSGEASAAVDVAGPVGMILQELISNAIEHAFPERRRGCVDVTFECHDAEYLIEVCDDGVGIPEARTSSNGFELVHGLCAQVGGHFEAYALTPHGTCCHLRLPRSARRN